MQPRGSIPLMASSSGASFQPSGLRIALILASAVVAISFGAIFARLAEAPGGVVALWRMVFAALLLAPAGIQGLRKSTWRRASVVPAVLAGILLGVHFATWLTSLQYTTVAASVTLVTTVPVWVTLIAWLGGTRPTRGVLLGLGLALTGGVMIGFGDLAGGSAPLLGDGLALVGALTGAGYFLLGRRAQHAGLSTNGYALVAYATAAIVLIPLPALLGSSYVAWPPMTWLWFALIALAPQLVGHGGLNWANRYIDPTLVATVVLLEPIGSGLLAWWLFTEIPGLGVLLGAPILLAGVALVVQYRRRGPAVRTRVGPTQAVSDDI